MGTTGLVEYFTTAARTFIFWMAAGESAPEVFEAQLGGDPVGEDQLRACADRLLIDFHGLPPGWDAGDDAARYREALSLPPAVNAAKRGQPVLQRNLAKPAFAYELDYWERLSSALLPPELRERLTDCELVCIVPHGPLHALPFSALRWSPDEYLIERFGLCFAPSASVLRWCRAKNRSRENGHRPASCLVAAVAAADDPDPADFEADGETLTSLVRERPGARVTRLVGPAPSDDRLPASKDLVKTSLEGHDIVHLACHGLFAAGGSDGAPLDDAGLLVSDGATALALSDFHGLDPVQRAPFFLSAREVLSVRLDADLVTLRACSSGRAEVGSGDELLGLTRAFLYAGTPSLLVSLWNVHKQSSQRLLDDFYRRWLDGEGTPKWRALQLAQQRLSSDPDYGHPYHWAPFILVGDWY